MNTTEGRKVVEQIKAALLSAEANLAEHEVILMDENLHLCERGNVEAAVTYFKGEIARLSSRLLVGK